MARTPTIALALMFTACTGVFGDTADSWADTASPVYDGPWQVDTIDWSCDPGSNRWTYYVVTAGWANSLTLDIVETGDGNWSTDPAAVWDEYHTFDDNLSYADDGSWDEWQVVLSGVGSPGSVVSGETTLYQCGYHSDDSLSWKVTMYGDSGELDCGMWGHRPYEAYGSSCYCFDC